MPFLDHLEELRWRVFRSALALIIGSVIGFYLVTSFDVPTLLMQPIQPHLSGDRLAFLRPTDAFIITLKLSLFVGAIVAFPVIFREVWAFLGPALYERERRMVMPAMLAGLGLFLSGVWMAFLWVLPAILRIMLSPRFVGTAFVPFITAGEYFGFATQVLLGFGLVFELPLVMVLLASMGLVSPRFFSKNRPYAFLIGSGVAAFVTPPDVFSMMMMMAPIILLYEVGILVGRIVWKRHVKAGAVIVLLALSLSARDASAQERRLPPPPPDSVCARQDSLRADSLARHGVGLPSEPSRSLPAADSI